MTLQEAFEKLTSKDPRTRMESALLAVNKTYWLSTPPDWFNLNVFPEVIGFDQKNVIIGTNLKNIKIISWDDLRGQHIYAGEVSEDFIKKVA